jgi:Flp pilus assembly protein TadG
MRGRNQDLRVQVTACERGQVALLSVVWMVVLLGLAGLVIDVGSWFLSQRQLQAQADASALAGAQSLPQDTSAAGGLAQQYATKNGFTLPTSGITITGTNAPNDSITVDVDKGAPTFFSKLFGIQTVPVTATATARSDLMGAAKWVAPITVNITHPMLSGQGCPCFGQDTTLPLSRLSAPGAFGLLDLDNGKGNGASTLGSWIQNGYDGYLPLGDYSSNTGAKFNSADVQSALTARVGTVLMFPVYDTLTGNGTNAVYHIIAWVGFRLSGFDVQGNSGTLSGSFTEITWEGIPASSGNPEPNLGARVVTLTH